MSKGSIRQKGSKWYYRFYIEDENGQHNYIFFLRLIHKTKAG